MKRMPFQDWWRHLAKQCKHNRATNTTEQRPHRSLTCQCLWFCRNHCNGLSLVPSQCTYKRHSPPEDIQNGGHLGGECLLYMHCLGTWQVHFDDESWCGRGYAFFDESVFYDSTMTLGTGIPIVTWQCLLLPQCKMASQTHSVNCGQYDSALWDTPTMHIF
jgi:hypothetical protein